MSTMKTNKPLLLTLVLLSASLCFALYAVRDTVFPDRTDTKNVKPEKDSALCENTEVNAVYIDEELPPLEAGMVNVTAGHAAYRVYPTGGMFVRPVSVRIGYDTLKIPHGHLAAEVRTYRYDDSLRHWVKLPLDSVMEGAQQVQSHTSKGGDMINAIVQMPELPESKSFTPTMLSELEAAHPATGVTMMQAPQANPQGTANLSYPITVPAGRNGIQPNLNISYNSGGGNGLLGMGWDMQIPAITVDSKWGVPRYDDEFETECYSYNGQELLPSPHYLIHWELRDHSTGYKVFYPRTEGSFDSIVRVGTHAYNYFWIVIDKSGTKYYYGSYDGVNPESAVLLKDGNGNIGHWPLCRVEDLDGNYMNYFYVIREQYKGLSYLGQQLWLESIEYTGNSLKAEQGVYHVFFGEGECFSRNDNEGDDPDISRYWYSYYREGEKGFQKMNQKDLKDWFGSELPADSLCDRVVKIVKEDLNSGKVIPDVVFRLNSGREFAFTSQTDENGLAGWGDQLPCRRTYCIDEIQPAPGYCTRLQHFRFRLGNEKDVCALEVFPGQGVSVELIKDTLVLHVKNMMCNTGDAYMKRPKLPAGMYSGMLNCDCETEYPYDLRTDARLGFLQSHKEKLRRVSVYCGDVLVRSYSFCYDKDIFGRAQLHKIRQWGSDYGEEPYDHELEYYVEEAGIRLDENGTEIGNASITAEDYRIAVPNKVVRPLQRITGNSLSDHSFLESSMQTSYGAGAGANLGVDKAVWSKVNSLGLDLGYNHPSGHGNTVLMDVTGDGLPDMVFKGSKHVFYKKQLSGGGFSAKVDTLRDFRYFLKDKGNSFGPSVSAAATGENLYGGLGGNLSVSQTTTYFSDMNGDGLPDMVSGDGAKAAVPAFNPFSFSCGECGVPKIDSNGSFYPDIRMEYRQPDPIEDSVCSMPYYDLVRVWECKINASYTINATAVFLPDTIPGSVSLDKDSIIVSVEYYGKTNANALTSEHILLAADTLGVGDTVWNGKLDEFMNTFSSINSYINDGVVELKRGGMLFFRARTFSGHPVSHLLQWNPQVTCDGVMPDPNGLMFPDAEPAARCQLLQGNGEFVCPFDGEILCSNLFVFHDLTDTVCCEIMHNDTSKYRYYAVDSSDMEINYSLAVKASDVLKFNYRCGSNVDLAANQWHPHLQYKHIAENNLVLDGADAESVEFWPLPHYDFYGYFENVGYASNKGIKTLKPISSQNSSGTINGPFRFTVKGSDGIKGLMYAEKFSQIPFTVRYTPTGGTDWRNQREFYFEDTNRIYSNVTVTDGCQQFSREKADLLFGQFYGGWSQFQYLHDDRSLMDTVKIFALKKMVRDSLDSMIVRKSKEYNDTNLLKNRRFDALFMEDTLMKNFTSLPLFANGETRRHEGLYPNSYIDGKIMSLGSMPLLGVEEDADEREVHYTASGEEKGSNGSTGSSGGTSYASQINVSDVQIPFNAMDKISRTYTRSVSYPHGNIGSGSTKMMKDIMDLNGDGVPDFIQEENVCYSVPCNEAGIIRWESEYRKVVFDKEYSNHSINHSICGSYTGEKSVTIPLTKNSGKGQHALKLDGSIGGSVNTATDYTETALADLNGDGLPDLVYQDGFVRLNMGYGFGQRRYWDGLDQIGRHTSVSGGASIGKKDNLKNISKWKGSINAGASYTLAENSTEYVLLDMNGDGLPDLVHKNIAGKIRYRLNTGSNFENDWRIWDHRNPDNRIWGTSRTAPANLKVTYGYEMFLVKVEVSPSVDGSVTHSNTRLQITDFNGDGIPDLLESPASDDEESPNVRYANLGRTGLLKCVTLPLGGSITMNYEMTEASVYHSRRWVMTEVAVNDSLPGNGADEMRTRFSYEYGYHDHTEREFLGFAKITTENLNADGIALRSTERFYANSDIHTSGQMLAELLYDSLHRKYIQTVNVLEKDTLEKKGLDGQRIFRVFPKLVRTQTCYFEGQPQAGITAVQTYTYDNTYGNLVHQTSESTGQPLIHTNIDYHPQQNGNHCVNKPSSVRIEGELRWRETSVDTMGHITEIRDYYGAGHVLVTRMSYDAYGNVDTLRAPNTAMYYSYDDSVHTYPVEIRDTFGVKSSMRDYDFRFGIPLTVTDPADNRMEYTLDKWGRTASIRSPKEIESGAVYTLRYTYGRKEHDRAVSMAMTEHYNPQDPAYPIKVYTYCDGLGKVVQTRKTSVINGADRLTVSGLTLNDVLGRTAASYYPTETSSTDTVFGFVQDSQHPSRATYDVLDRPLRQMAPDNTTTSFAYGFNRTHLGKTLFSTVTTDANGHSSTELKDVDGKPWAIQAAGHPFVYFDYNAVGDNTRTYASTGEWERTYAYDQLGRKTAYCEGPLSEEYRYDGPNLSEHVYRWEDEMMGNTSRIVRYVYDAHRLLRVEPDDALSTEYRYDKSGRVDTVYDESGVMCYEYGNMGEITKETRIYALPFVNQPLVLTTQYGYDSWGRTDSIVYPDGEVVHYAYDHAGQLEKMYNLQFTMYNYLDSIKYDRFGAKTQQIFGNGLRTEYTYDPVMRRLDRISTRDAFGGTQSHIEYAYDSVGNITQLSSGYPWDPGKNFTEYFSYDEGDQLLEASSAEAQGNPVYGLSLTYNDWGRMEKYGFSYGDQASGVQQERHYDYFPDNVFAAQHYNDCLAGEDVFYFYGINGSLRHKTTNSGTGPFEEFYLFAASGNLQAYCRGYNDYAWYGYDASNTRTYKLRMQNAAQWHDGCPDELRMHADQAVFYPNQYLTFDQDGRYTKHYYAGSQRIASRLGENSLQISSDNFPQEPHGILSRQRDLMDELYVRRRELRDKMFSQLSELITLEPGRALPVEMETFGISSLETTAGDLAVDIYYYSVNHLGSTAFTTDGSCSVTQGFVYAPFGEIVAEYQGIAATAALPKYAFNAKELDEESGMYYYEARYYAPPTFTSRDPLFEQKPWLTPYHYCSNNPVGRVDPTGMFDDEAEANKFHQRAVKKYGSERVGDVRQNAESGEYYFNVYGKDEVSSNKDGGLKGGVVTLNSINVKAGNERSVASRKGYKSLLKRDMRSGEVAPSKSFRAGQSIRNFEDKFVDASQAVLSGAVLFNPIVGVANDAMTLITGEDMYGNTASSVDKWTARIDLLTLGFSSKLIGFGTNADKVMERLGMMNNLFSGGKVTYNEYEKTKK